MKSFHFITFISALIACMFPFLSSAQLSTFENIPITFYGKVVDQNGEPLAGAKISLDVVISRFEMNDTEAKPVKLETDQNGNFLLTGFTGYAVDKISVEKLGYELSQKTQRGYVFAIHPDYHFDPDHPVIFKMWKQKGKEPLIESAWGGKVICDGTTNRFDLPSGHPSANGDLEIICSRRPLQLPPHTNSTFDYSFRLVVVGGGVQPTDDEFSYFAPENGYSKNFTIQHKATDTNWTAKVRQEFYIKTAEGHYGRLWVDWYSTLTSPTHLEWNCSINPSGSRNLER